MNKNVVDGFGDEYFINEYVGGLYIHNGLLYQLKGFNVNGVYIKGAKRYAEASGLTKATFGSLEALREWLKRQRAHLETMQEYPPDQYYTYEDDDGDMVESVLININDFTSLKGFKLQQGWINVKNRLFSINGRRCHKINDNTVKMLQENPKYAEQFINPTYPTLKEALEMLKKGDDLDAVAISRKVRLSKETRYKENGEVYRIKWRLESLTGEELAGWVEGNKTIWAKNNKVFSYINKKG